MTGDADAAATAVAAESRTTPVICSSDSITLSVPVETECVVAAMVVDKPLPQWVGNVPPNIADAAAGADLVPVFVDAHQSKWTPKKQTILYRGVRSLPRISDSMWLVKTESLQSLWQHQANDFTDLTTFRISLMVKAVVFAALTVYNLVEERSKERDHTSSETFTRALLIGLAAEYVLCMLTNSASTKLISMLLMLKKDDFVPVPKFCVKFLSGNLGGILCFGLFVHSQLPFHDAESRRILRLSWQLWPVVHHLIVMGPGGVCGMAGMGYITISTYSLWDAPQPLTDCHGISLVVFEPTCQGPTFTRVGDKMVMTRCWSLRALTLKRNLPLFLGVYLNWFTPVVPLAVLGVRDPLVWLQCLGSWFMWMSMNVYLVCPFIVSLAMGAAYGTRQRPLLTLHQRYHLFLSAFFQLPTLTPSSSLSEKKKKKKKKKNSAGKTIS
eukprot:NODE_6666_length_1650_cov_11.561392.p1 GENE.NODE_6666_length_1650_cov_11.561392~~NODE_6666_length_1650_cov_11.561392.p1  ORF type:complete len:512 (+),score=75.11 NODE_6666_length_1650_cov_11.561392:219-1538(+)